MQNGFCRAATLSCLWWNCHWCNLWAAFCAVQSQHLNNVVCIIVAVFYCSGSTRHDNFCWLWKAGAIPGCQFTAKRVKKEWLWNDKQVCLPHTLISNELSCAVLLQYFTAVVTRSCCSISGWGCYGMQAGPIRTTSLQGEKIESCSQKDWPHSKGFAGLPRG